MSFETIHQNVVSQSLSMSNVLRQIKQVAKTSTTVLILGETGVGKGVLAQQIHSLSLRRTCSFVSVNCGALPPGLVESELFGHEKGAFTSAVGRRTGRFEQAHKGTLFLDEIGDLPLEAQRVLLHVLEDYILTRVGGENPIKVDVRVIAATNRDLQQATQERTFRADLFYRLNVFPIVIPPLRERQEEIPVLAAHFAAQCAQKLRQPVPHLSNEVLVNLQRYNWPGNIRELEHLIQRAVIICRDNFIQMDDVDVLLSAKYQAAAPAAGPSIEQEVGAKSDKISEAEKQLLIEALETTNWVIYGKQGAAHLLGVNPERLRSRMRVHGWKIGFQSGGRRRHKRASTR